MFEDYTPKTIWARIVSELDTGLLTSEGSFVYDVCAPLVWELYRVYLSMNALQPVFYIDETSGPYIDKMCSVFGMTRKAGSKAACSVTFEGTDGTTIPAGAVFLTADGLAFALDAQITVAGGTATGALTAAEAGAKYNIPAGALIRPQVSHYGITSFLNGPAAGGADAETDAALVYRFYQRMRCPPTSGNAYHSQTWALEVDGVGAARVIGLWDGPGTVKVILAGAELLPVDEAVVSACASHIEAERPVGVAVACVSAEGVAIDVAAHVSVSGTTTVEAVAERFAAALAEYLFTRSSADFPTALNAEIDDLPAYCVTVNYNKIAALLIDCDGVLDFEDLTVNGGTENLTLELDQLPVPGEVTLT